MLTKLWRSLPFQTGFSIALGAVLLTLILSITVYNWTIKKVVRDSNLRISQLVSTVERSASIAAYLDNSELALDVTQGLVKNDIVTGVSLRSDSGMRIISGSPFNFNEDNILHYPLANPFMTDEKTGDIFIKPNQSNIDAQATQMGLVFVFTLTTHSLIITIFVIFLVQRRLTRHLTALAKTLHKIEPGSAERLLCPPEHRKDEIGLLVQDTNQLLAAVQNTLEGERRLREYAETLERQTRKEAERDPLTNLLNRRAGERAIARALQKADANKTRCAIMLIDLDKFKPINDTYGHDAGDHTLVTISDRLTKTLRKNDIVIRWGGDEFLILVQQGHGDLEESVIADKILAALAVNIDLNENTKASIGGSIGISLYPDHGTDATHLIDLADKAMYHIKRSGRNGHFIHTPGDSV